MHTYAHACMRVCMHACMVLLKTYVDVNLSIIYEIVTYRSATRYLFVNLASRRANGHGHLCVHVRMCVHA